MMLVDFDHRGFCDAVAAKIEQQGKGAKQRALEHTGIPQATFHRMVDGPAVRNIGAILSAAAYFDLRLADFVKVAGRPSRPLALRQGRS